MDCKGLTGHEACEQVGYCLQEAKHTCRFHESEKGKIAQLVEEHEELRVELKGLKRYVNIGIGLFLGGALIVSVLLMNMESVKADVEEDIHDHQTQIEKQQDRVANQMNTMTVTVTALQNQVAILATQVENLQETIKEDRVHQREDMEDLKDVIRYRLEGTPAPPMGEMP